jgi:hypothetical protein
MPRNYDGHSGRNASDSGLLADLKALLAARPSAGDPDLLRLAALKGRIDRRLKFLEGLLSELQCWSERELLRGDELERLLRATGDEMAGLRDGLAELQRPVAKPAIPIARLVVEDEQPPEAVADALPAPASEPQPEVEAAGVRVIQEPVSAIAVEERVAGDVAGPEAEPRQPWYTQDRNLRILANLGILVFNIGLVGFITSAWGGWQDATKVAVLSGYTALLLIGGLLLRVKTKLAVTGMSLLALGVLGVPIVFFSLHFYNLTGLGSGALGLMGAGSCLLVSLGVGAKTREKLFFWFAYLAVVSGACYLCDALGLEFEKWAGPLIVLFGASAAVDTWARKKNFAPDSLPGLLLSPAAVVSAVGACAALLVHLFFWLGLQRISAEGSPAAVIVPLVLSCIFFMGYAWAQGQGWLLAVAGALKLMILGASLQALAVPLHEYPVYYMLLGVLLVSCAGFFRSRLAAQWTLPHYATGWVAAIAALLCAGAVYVSDPSMSWSAAGMSAMDVFILTVAPALVAATVFAAARGRLLPTVLAALLATLQCALLLKRYAIPWESVPLCYALLAALVGLLGAVAGRNASREEQGEALTIAGYGLSVLGLICLLSRIESFWWGSGARWALLFSAVILAAYVSRSLLWKAAAVPVMLGFYAVLVFGSRSLGWEWTALAPVLAGGALLSAAVLWPLRSFRDAALCAGHAAGWAALALAFFTYIEAPEQSHWGLLAVGLVAVLHLGSAVAKRLAVMEYTGLLVAGAALLLSGYELGAPVDRLGLLALGLPLVYFVLEQISRKLEWKLFDASAAFAGALSACAALVFTVAFGGGDPDVLPGLMVMAAVLVLPLVVVLALGDNDQGRGLVLTVLEAVGAGALVVAAAAQVLWCEASLWPQLALLAMGCCYAYSALRRGRRLSEYLSMTVIAAAYLLVFPEFEMEASRYGMVAMALPLAFYGISAIGRDLEWKSFVQSSFDMVVPAAVAVLVLSVFGWLGGAYMAVVVIAAALLGAGFVSLVRGRTESHPALAGHCIAAVLVAIAVGVQVLRDDAPFLPQLALAVFAGLQVMAAVDRKSRPLEYSSLMLLGVVYVLILRDCGLKARDAGLATCALPAAYYVLSLVAERFSWKSFRDSAFDVAVPAAAAVLVLTVLGWVHWGLVVAAVVLGGLVSIAYLLLAGCLNSRGLRSAGAALATLGLIAGVALQVQREHLFLLPQGALAALAVLQVWVALRRRMVAVEYCSLAVAGGAWLLMWQDAELPLENYCLAAVVIPLAFYGLSAVGKRLSWKAYAGSAFDMAAPAAALAVTLAFAFSLGKPVSRAVWYRADLCCAIGTTAALAAAYLALSYTRNARKWLDPSVSNFLGSALVAASYLLILRVFSRGTPYRALWIMGIVPVLLAYGVVLVKRGMKLRGYGPLLVGVGVSLGSLWQALLFPEEPLVATLAFVVAAAFYGVLAGTLNSTWFGAAASAAFSVGYFSLLRKLGVPAENYVLWLVGLGIMQSVVGGLDGKGARQRRPAMFVGMLLSIGIVSWMVYQGEVYFARGGAQIDTAIWTVLGTAAVFAVVALLRRSRIAAYGAAVALLGSYYLVLHRFAVGYTEFYTIPIAVMTLAWARLVVQRRWGALYANVAAAAGIALLLMPSLALSLDRHDLRHLGHMFWALGLSMALVAAGMGMRRKAYLIGGTIGFAAEALVKLYHFKLAYNVSDWIWLLLVGVVILGFVVYAETKRNKRLKVHADEARERLAKMFEDWE